jgi:hypothetical protein
MLEDEAEWMLPAIEETLEDNIESEVHAYLSGRTTAVTAAEIFLVPFMTEDLRDWIDEVRILSRVQVFAMAVEDGRWVCTD